MGKTFLFECPRCAYQARVSGRVDRGFNVWVETIACWDCRRLYDAVVRLRVEDKALVLHGPGAKAGSNGSLKAASFEAPSLQAALNRLTLGVARRFKWVQFPKRCPVSSLHRIRSWTDPEKCPQCGTYLERHGLPYRIWD
jgi:hypothetical protein